MAIHDVLPGVEVEVTVGGVPLEEYVDDDHVEEANTTTRYIEARSGQQFMVRCKAHRYTKLQGDMLCFKVQLDGQTVSRKFITASELRKHETVCSTASYARVSSDRARDFEFAHLETTSDDVTLSERTTKVKDLGTIRIEVHHKWRGEEKPAKTATSRGTTETGVVSEKALKGQALSHSVKYGTIRPVRPVSSKACSSTFVDSKKQPAAIFVFRYRSLDSLKSMLIIPRTPSPEPEIPLEERDFDSLTQNEQREVFQRLQARDAAVRAVKKETRTRIKRERTDDNEDDGFRCKRRTGDTQLSIDVDGSFRETSTPSLPRAEPEIIVLD